MKFGFLVKTMIVPILCAYSAAIAESAESPVKIVAVVGEDIISDYELNNHLKFLAETSGLKDTDNIEVKRQVLNSLIDDVIKKQEADKNGITNSDKDIEDAIAAVEQNNGMEKGSLKKKLQKAGIPYDTLRNQVSSDLLWIKNAHMTIAPHITISEEELSERFEQYKNEEQKVRFLLGDIFLPVESELDDEKVRKQAEDIIKSLQAGESFNVLALRYSASASAQSGGDTGWLAEDELDRHSLEAIKTLERGQITVPIKTTKGYYIWLLRDKFDVNEQKKLSLAKVTVPNEYKKTHTNYLKNLREKGTDCPAFIAEGKKIYSDGSGMLNEAFLEDFPENVQKVIQNLEPLSVSMAVNDDEKSMYFMICSAPNQMNQITKEAMKNKIETEKLEAAANKKLRELRNSTIIENRLSDK